MAVLVTAAMALETCRPRVKTSSSAAHRDALKSAMMTAVRAIRMNASFVDDEKWRRPVRQKYALSSPGLRQGLYRAVDRLSALAEEAF
jgi:hypothetical protein